MKKYAPLERQHDPYYFERGVSFQMLAIVIAFLVAPTIIAITNSANIQEAFSFDGPETSSILSSEYTQSGEAGIRTVRSKTGKLVAYHLDPNQLFNLRIQLRAKMNNEVFNTTWCFPYFRYKFAGPNCDGVPQKMNESPDNSAGVTCNNIQVGERAACERAIEAYLGTLSNADCENAFLCQYDRPGISPKAASYRYLPLPLTGYRATVSPNINPIP